MDQKPETSTSSLHSQSKTTVAGPEEFCTQFQTKIQDPVLVSDNELPGPISADTSISESPKGEVDWKFECEKVPLDTYGCQNGKEDSDHDLVSNIGSNLLEALGLGPTQGQQHQEGGSAIDLLLNMKDREEIGAGPSTSAEYVRQFPQLVKQRKNSQRIPHDEILGAIGGFTNMFLAHEIAVNEDFQVENLVQKEDTLQTRVQTQMKRAFWDLFDTQIQECPPNYTAACTVLKDIKSEMLSLLLPHNVGIRQRITDEIDISQIENQLANQAFDSQEIQRHSTFVINILAQICCPARDAEVESLRTLQSGNLTNLFRGILDMIQKMKLDMANFLVRDARPVIIRQVIQYERIKFAQFLELEYRLNDDGLKATRLWLNRHRAEDREIRYVISRAYAELLDYNHTFPWPETMTLDTARLQSLGLQVRRLGIIGAVVLSIGSVFQGMFGGKFITELREKCKKHLKLLLTPDDMKTETSLNEAMLRLGEECCTLADSFVQNQLNRGIDSVEGERIRKCVEEVVSPDHKICALIMRRLKEHIQDVAVVQHDSPVPMPPGLSIIHYEVSGAIAHFYRIINFNRRVYGEVYKGILRGKIHAPKYPQDLDGKWDPGFCELLKGLRENHEDADLYEQMRNEDIQRIREAEAKIPDGIK